MSRGLRPERARRFRVLVACLGTVVTIVATAVVVTAIRGDDVATANPQPTGEPFPDFTVDGADGAPITTAALEGQPTLVWFSDSTCPDVDDVHRIASLDDETGGDALQILMVFIDPYVNADVAREWRDLLGRPDWLLAPDTDASLAAMTGVQALETKVLLDEHAQILDTQTGPVDETYLGMLRQRVST